MPALAQSETLIDPLSGVPEASSDRNVFVFGGIFSPQSVGETLGVIGTEYTDAFILGGGYQQFFYGEEGGLRLGGEYGVALRTDPDPSAEVWAGAVIRADSFIQNDDIKISASVTGGFSATTGALDIEVDREVSRGGGDSSFLFYMAPELSLSMVDNPDLEYFWRVQHRSGGWETLGGMGEGSNASTLGVRFKF